jgi:hypothetical protein
MTIISEPEVPLTLVSARVKARVLEQMAEALEDEVGGLYRRAAAFEEEESLLNTEIGERQTEINRLVLKLDGMRAERDRLMEKIDMVSHEAALMRERVFNCHEVSTYSDTAEACSQRDDDMAAREGFFRRATLIEHSPHT